MWRLQKACIEGDKKDVCEISLLIRKSNNAHIHSTPYCYFSNSDTAMLGNEIAKNDKMLLVCLS